MNLYDHSLQGHEATLENAQNHARGIDWQSIEKTENPNITNVSYKDTINGIDIYYCYGTDTYLFTDAD